RSLATNAGRATPYLPPEVWGGIMPIGTPAVNANSWALRRDSDAFQLIQPGFQLFLTFLEQRGFHLHIVQDLFQVAALLARTLPDLRRPLNLSKQLLHPIR